MEIIKKDNHEPEHPYVPELKHLYRGGRISRREFLRNATLLGVSFLSASSFLAACSPQPEPMSTAESATQAPQATGPKRGGSMRVGQRIPGFDHPARMSWEEHDITRLAIEYLTFTDRENITHPMLLDRWEVSDDLLTWTLYLREGVTWSTGEPLVADDVTFTMKQWLDPDVGSSTLGLMGSYLTVDNIEKVDDLTLKLHLDRPEIAVPEHLYHYPNAILDHRTFEGDWLKNPVGTGPFTLEEYSVEERAVLKAREGYWKNGADGEPLPYLDEIVMLDLGDDSAAYVSALKAGEMHVYNPESGLDIYEALQGDDNIRIETVPSAASKVLRMRVDKEPWTDARVRNALKLCQDREKLLNVAQKGLGTIGADCHVAPAMADYAPIEPRQYDPEKAKELLEEAGYPDGVDVTLTIGSGWTDIVSIAETLKQDAEPAGIRININAVPNSTYWDQWTEADMGITFWSHRPLAVMLLPLAYVCDDEGNPVSWNESKWCDAEFEELLTKASGILDVEKRREVVKQLEEIQKERGSIAISYFADSLGFYNSKYKGMKVHPVSYNILKEAWYDPEA